MKIYPPTLNGMTEFLNDFNSGKNPLEMEISPKQEPTPEQWGKWLNHKSNKERFMEAQEAGEIEIEEQMEAQAELETKYRGL